MPSLQLRIDDVLDTEIFPDFVKAERGLRERIKQGKVPVSADVRIVPVAAPAAASDDPDTQTPSDTADGPVRPRIVREKYVRAPHHNTVMTGALLIGMVTGWCLHYLV